jgi:hypothetical protein
VWVALMLLDAGARSKPKETLLLAGASHHPARLRPGCQIVSPFVVRVLVWWMYCVCCAW